MTRTCKTCNTEKPLESFHESNFGKYRVHVCRPCTATARKLSGANRIKKYDLPPAEYNLMCFAQGGVCAICKCKEFAKGKNGVDKGLAVDHNHKCCGLGKACVKCRRGLLCYKCNQALGSFKDNVEMLRSAIAYLEAWSVQGL